MRLGKSVILIMYILQLAAVHDDLRKKNDDLQKENTVHVREKDELRKENIMLKMKIQKLEQHRQQDAPVRRRCTNGPARVDTTTGKSK